jgi:uncharacterized ion transporter superfamily protein YfcC
MSTTDGTSTTATTSDAAPPPVAVEDRSVDGDDRPKRSFQFPSAVTTLAIVTVLVWLVALVIPSGQYDTDQDGSPIPGTFQETPSPLTFGESVEQLVLSPINGTYGLLNPDTDVVDTETVGTMFGQIGVIVFIMAIGAFISVSFATRSLEVAVSALAHRLKSKGWLLIAAVMVLFSLLGSTMGFSVETFGFYALFIPLMAALGYDRMVTASMIILGALSGVMGATVNPFSIGVAAGEANVSIGDGIALRLLLWVVLTTMSVLWVLRYAARIQRDPTASLVGWDDPDADDTVGETTADGAPHDDAPADRMDGTQKWVLAITIGAFGLMIFSVIPWSSIFGAATGPADYLYEHETSVEPYWFELNWWFPQLAMLFVLASVVVGIVARLGEKETVRLIGAGAADMISPALVVLLAGGVSVIMTNTQTLDTILNSMEQLVSGSSAGMFGFITIVVNVLLAILIPSSSGHAALAMPLLAPLADFAGVSRSTTITAWITGHGLTLLWSPTSVVVVGGLAIAKVRYDRYLRLVWPLLLAMFVVSTAIVAVAATLE